MCGIAGVVGAAAQRASVEAMTAALHHRGPDDRDVWQDPGVCLGHTRLSIIDLSAAGRQPMAYGDYVIVYNGEIYNCAELRRELPGPFHSASDTEVLLHLYAREGDACVQRLRGMFAFAIWDRRRRRLFAARDRLGIKPLYYRRLGDGLAFSSELKALVALGTPPVDPSALRDYFTYSYVPAPKSIYREIAKLPAAHTLLFEDGRLEVARYWSPGAEIVHRDMGAAGEALDGLLRESFNEQTVADVPVGVFLSGGVDSATTAYYLGRPETFTLGFDATERSEAEAARRVAEHLGTHHHEATARGIDMDEALETIPRIYDEPFGDSAAWSTWLVSQMARRHVTVALSGEGGDELFAGYPRHRKGVAGRSGALVRLLAAWLPPLSRAGYALQRRAATGLEGYAARLGVFTQQQKRALLHPSLLEPGYDDLWSFRQHWREDLLPLQRLRWLDLHTNLPDGLLTKVDRASMAHSLEVRPPFLDHRVVELAFSLHPDLLLEPGTGRGKRILRELMAPRLPPGHLERPKQGFGMPVRRWLQGRPQVLARALARLADAGILRSPRGGSFHKGQLWTLLVLDRWIARH